MKPDYRNSARPLSRAALVATYAGDGGSRACAPGESHASGPLQWVSVRLGAWLRSWRRKRDERMQVEELAPLGDHVLRDLWVSEELRLRALAQRESQYERLERSFSDAGGLGGRFGPW